MYVFFIFSLTLSERTFSTLDFYRTYQSDLTPAGLAFFQTDWDDSVPDFYHKILGKYFRFNPFALLLHYSTYYGSGKKNEKFIAEIIIITYN